MSWVWWPSCHHPRWRLSTLRCASFGAYSIVGHDTAVGRVGLREQTRASSNHGRIRSADDRLPAGDRRPRESTQDGGARVSGGVSTSQLGGIASGARRRQAAAFTGSLADCPFSAASGIRELLAKGATLPWLLLLLLLLQLALKLLLHPLSLRLHNGCEREKRKNIVSDLRRGL